MMLSLYLLLALQTASAAPVPVTIEEYSQLRELGSVRAAPDRQALAFTVRWSDPAAGERRSELYLWEPRAGSRSLTPGRDDVARPRWSPEGSWLAFLGEGEAEDGRAAEVDGTRADDSAGPTAPRQLWLAPVRSGGEPVQVTRLAGGVLDYGWAPDGGSVFALTRESGSDGGALGAAAGAAGPSPGAPAPRREIWRVSVPDGAAERLWRGDRGMAELAVSPDGRHVAFSTNYTGEAADHARFDLWVFDLDRGDARRLTDRPGPEVAPIWSPDGDRIIYRAPQNAGLPHSQAELFQLTIEDGATRMLTEAFDRAVLQHAWPTDGRLLFTAALGAYTHLFAVAPNGGLVQLTRGTVNYDDFDVAVGGATTYAVREAADEPAEVWRVQGGGVERLTRLNEFAERWRTARQEVVRWRAPDGLAVEGLLVYPAGYREGERYPLLVNPHGARRIRDVLDQEDLYQAFAAHGYAVLVPNFRGSIGYGEAFGTATRQELAGGDLTDILSGVDHVIDLGVADPARIGIYGTGYGAHLTHWAITQTARLRAAVSLHGILGSRAAADDPALPSAPHARAVSDEGSGPSPDRSPMQFVNRINIPLMMIHGRGADLFTAESDELYRALRQLERTVERVEYPGAAGNGSETGPTDRIDVFFRVLRWFDRHLKLDGADVFAFYLANEWVPGPNGWRMRVVRAEPRSEYLGLGLEQGRYLEVGLVWLPDTATGAAGPAGASGPLEIDVAGAVRLIGPQEREYSPVGTVMDAFGERTLLRGRLGSVQMDPSAEPAAATLLLAFEIPDLHGEYHLKIGDFPPVRIWLPRVNGGPAPDPRRGGAADPFD